MSYCKCDVCEAAVASVTAKAHRDAIDAAFAAGRAAGLEEGAGEAEGQASGYREHGDHTQWWAFRALTDLATTLRARAGKGEGA